MCPPNDSPIPSCAVGMGCIESAFLVQSIPCIKSPIDDDLAPLLVYLQYLSQLEVCWFSLLTIQENPVTICLPWILTSDICLFFYLFQGPMWKQIRGQGLSYSYSVFPSTHEGLLYLVLYRATNVVAAYKEARNILVSFLKLRYETVMMLLDWLV